MRIASDREKRFRDGSIGWVHKLGSSQPTSRDYAPATRAEIELDVEAVLRRWSMDTHPAMIDELALSLGVTSASLSTIMAVWSKRFNAWAFPMYAPTDGLWEPCGLRLRNNKGDKWSLKGSHAGLFVPRQLVTDGPMFITEGPTDTAAMLSLGFNAVGRASCNSGTEYLRALLIPRQDVVILSDADTPGRLGAARLALELQRPVKIIEPLKGKDARQWKQQGATRELIQAVVRNSQWVNRSQLHGRVRELTDTLRRQAGKNASNTKTAISTSPSGASPDGVL